MKAFILLLGLVFAIAIETPAQQQYPLDYCVAKASITLDSFPAYNRIPRSILNGRQEWQIISSSDWCSGFWPGILWYLFEYTKDKKWQSKANSFTLPSARLAFKKASDHDLGFQLFTSFGNGYRLTEDTFYKRVLLSAADTLATLYNPKVGTILSWPFRVKRLSHNTIMDNMMNLELLFWASKNGGSKLLYEIAYNHAFTTMINQFREDYSSYHVVMYDTITGKKIKGVTYQGYSDSSMWARGQAWAIYGFTMCYRETKERKFLETAERAAGIYLKKLPDDMVPFWDFNDPAIPVAPKDASAAAITASALLELSVLVNDKIKSSTYRKAAEKMLGALSLENYQSRNLNSAFLLHSTGNKRSNGEVDASIIYGDYYYLEALLRLHKLQAGKSIYKRL
ncbi:MAG TPA: glycoside hydrolase family 88 protein [Phnomibacter sp.]|nr:glycoside hydrolase family 88 protein [Phnomibacter sp.]